VRSPSQPREGLFYLINIKKQKKKNMYYNENTVTFYNGKFMNAPKAVSDLYGQTLHYGYGVFEGIRAYDTDNGVRIFKAKEHYERLKRSAELLNIPFMYDPDELTEVTYELLRRNQLKNAYVRPLVFCDPNMSLTRPKNVSLMICAWEWGAYLGDKQLRLMVSSYCRPHPRSTRIEAKACGHYVNSILATTEAKDNGYDEALLLDCEGHLAEGPGANFFFEKDGKLFTPQTGNILPGITRATVLEICRHLDIEVCEGLYELSDLQSAESAFYCGTAAEVIGLHSVNGETFSSPWENSLSKVVQQAYKLAVLKKDYSKLLVK
jgi:branched-chain amino acid aminotransferase